MAKLTVRDLNVRGKRVFVRVDYNVPLEEKGGEMVITDATRITETLPTLRLLMASVMVTPGITQLASTPCAENARDKFFE